MLKTYLRPIDLARQSGVSTQAIRNYEQWGILPPSERSVHGYRLYNERHVHALLTARVLMESFGWARAAHMMQAIHQNNLAGALVEIDAHHAAIHASRVEIEQMLEILRQTATTLTALTENSRGTKKRVEYLRIGEVAHRVGVRVSAVRFWEDQGLLQPTRDSESKYRLYDATQVRRLQIVVLLRKAGYDFAAIHTVLAQLETGTPEEAVSAAEKRLQELAENSRRCVEATAALWEYWTQQAEQESSTNI